MFIPSRIIFEKGSINYNIGRNIYDNFSSKDNIEIINLNSNKYKQYIPGGIIYILNTEKARKLDSWVKGHQVSVMQTIRPFNFPP